MNPALRAFNGSLYPTFLSDGNAQQYVAPIARQFCRGVGLDIGAGQFPFAGARPIDRNRGEDAMALPEGAWDYVFSSHLLEHLPNPVAAIEHWKTRIRGGGVLFLYLPHPDCKPWSPAANREHLHVLHPGDVADMLRALGFIDVLYSGRDLAFGYSVVGFNGEST